MKNQFKKPAARLAYYKELEKNNSHCNWREFARGHYLSESPVKLVRPSNPVFSAYGRDRLQWIEDTTAAGLRFVGYADQICPTSILHTGWFTDNYQSETIRGAVWQLPSRHGESLFLAGYEDNNNPGSALIDLDISIGDSPRDSWDNSPRGQSAAKTAASWADSLAQRVAENERECHAKDMAEQDIEAARENLTRLRKEYRELCAELQRVNNGDINCPAICRSLSATLSDIKAARNEQLEIINERRANYWSAVHNN